MRSEEHTSELQSPCNLVCRLLLEKKKKKKHNPKMLSMSISTSRPADITSARMCALRAAALVSDLIPLMFICFSFFFFFFNDTATTEIYTLSLHDALPIYHLIAVAPVDPFPCLVLQGYF